MAYRLSFERLPIDPLPVVHGRPLVLPLDRHQVLRKTYGSTPWTIGSGYATTAKRGASFHLSYCSPRAMRPCAWQKNKASFRFSSIRMRDTSCPLLSALAPFTLSKRISLWRPVPRAGPPFNFTRFILFIFQNSHPFG